MKDMEKFTQVNKSSVMVTKWSRNGREMVSIKPLLIMLALLMVALFGVNESAWGNEISIETSGFQNIISNNTVSLGGNHVSFSLEGNGNSITYGAPSGLVASEIKLGAPSRGNSITYKFSYSSLNSGHSIKVTKVQVYGLSQASGTMSLNGGTASDVYSGINNYTEIKTENSNGLSFPMNLVCKNTRWTNGNSQFFIKKIVITYTITPPAPSVSPNTASVNVTLNANSPTNLNVAGNFSSTDHYSSKSYTISTNPESAGHLNGTNFYATDSGTYVVKAKYNASTGCHEVSDWSDPLTITVNPFNTDFDTTNGSIEWSDNTKVNTIDLRTLVSGYNGNGSVTFSKVTKSGYANVSNATIASDGYSFSATALGTYRIKATYAATKQYRGVSKEFDVVVGKRTPTFEWKAFDHIYASDTLENVAQAKYNGNNVDGLSYTYSSNSAIVVVVGTSLRVQNTFVGEHDVKISVSTVETDYYKAGSDTHEYRIEPKATPEFWLNESVDLPADTVDLNLLIGETAAMRFVNTDESNFQYPTSASYISYSHNSGDHTGVITGTVAGDEYIQFHQGGTTTIFDHLRSIHVYVSKHPVNLTTTLDGGTWKVDSIFDGAVYSIVTPTGDQPALSEVTVTSSNEAVLKKVDGHWKAVGEGEAMLTISHPNTNNYWAGQTVTATITVVKHTPKFTWHLPETVNYNRSFAEPVSSTNTDEGCTFTYVSGNTAAINYVNGALKTFEKTASNVAITVTQAGNYKWAEHSETFHVNVEKLADHVPFTMNTSTIRDAVYSGKANKGSISCSAGGTITLDQNGGILIATANALYYDIHFSGIPNSVSFKYQQSMATSTALGSTGHSFTVYQKGETGGWSELWTSNGATGDKSEHSVTINNDKLLPSTRYLRFFFDGTYTGYYKNISITERTEITGIKTVDFGASNAGSNASVENPKISWYNVNPLTLTIEGENASQFAVSPTEIASAKDAYAENVPLTISYIHNRAAVKDTATLVITDGVTTKRIGLCGTTNKVTPAIIWKENLSPMQRGVGVKNPATSSVALTYTSSDPTVVNVIGDSIAPLKKGNATITASFDGSADPVYNSASSTQEVVVTDVKVQHISWTQNFKRLKWTDDEELSAKNTPDFPLEAKVSYYDADKKEEIIIDRPITFTSNDNSVVQVLNGTTLHVVGTGTTTLEAHVEGITDSLYEATAVRDVIVREPSLDCESWVLKDKGGSINTINVYEFTLEDEADTIYFDAWREAIKVVIDYTSGDLYLDEVYENESTKNIWHNETKKNTHTSYKALLSRKAKKVRFYTTVGATGYHIFDGVYARRARYVEFENGKDTMHLTYTKEDAKPGVAKTKSFNVKFSNITDQLEFEFKGGANSKFSVVSPASIGTQCGDHGEATVTVQFLSNDVETYRDTLLIKNLNQLLTVYLEAEVDKHHQQITWNPVTELKTTDVVSFDATTSASAAGLSVRYEVVEGDAATVNAVTGALTIIKDGDVTIKATAAGNASYYDAEPVSKTFSISKVTPEITVVPTAATMTLPNTNLSDCALIGGVASVAGTFAWADNTIDAAYNNAGYMVIFTPENSNWYASTNCVVVVPVNKSAQTIVWDFDQLEMYCNAQITFDAHSSTGLAELPVSYSSSDESIAYVDGNNHLNIIKGGEVTITATQGGNAIYAAAESVSKTLTIKRFAPTIVTLPSASNMKIGCVLSDASLTGGRAELDAVKVEGSFAWVDGNTTVMDVAGTFSKQIVFTPSNTNYYEPVYGYKSVTVEKYAPEIAQTLHGSDITYGQALSASNLSGSLTATDMIKIPSEEVDGTYTWLQPSAVLNAGTQSATVRFTPANMDWYEAVDFPVQLTVNRATADGLTVTGTSEIFYGQILGEAVPMNTTVDPIHGGVVAGTMVWSSSLNLDEYMEVGSHNLSVTFTVNDPNYISATLDGTAVLTVQAGYVFNGNDGQSKTWGEDTNWQGNEAPIDNESVVILADVDITTDVEVESMTIKDGVTVVVKDGATLTIGSSNSFVRKKYGNLHVEKGGMVILGNGELNVNNFILEASIGNISNPATSGQVTGEEQLKVAGDAYFQISFDPSGNISYGWYDFVLPFDVDVRNGIYLASDPATPLQNNVDFAIMAFSEEKRAANVKPWSWFSGTLEAGRLYTITLDETKPERNTYLFKKKAGASLVGPESFDAVCSNNSEATNRGWNGLGNGTLRYCQLNSLPMDAKMQIYDHANDCYVAREASSYTYAVGTAFFIQVLESQEIELSQVTEDHGFLSPARTNRTVNEFRLALQEENASIPSDYLWVSASEEATGEYVIGHDLLKMGTPAAAKTAQMWTNSNGLLLCDFEMPLVLDKAVADLSLYVPKDGVYTLNIEKAPEDATLYLTYNNRVIWNLSMSPYDFDLTKGTTEGYGLRLVAETPQVTTDLENEGLLNGADGVRKVLIDNVLYIITPEGKMYDIVGKGIKF